MQETRVRFLGQEDPLEESMGTHSSIVAWRIPIDRGAWRASVHGLATVHGVRHHGATEHAHTQVPGVYSKFSIHVFSMFVCRTTKSCKPVGEDFTRALSRVPWLTCCGFICSFPTSVGFGFCTLIVRVLPGYNTQCSPYPISDGCAEPML